MYLCHLLLNLSTDSILQVYSLASCISVCDIQKTVVVLQKYQPFASCRSGSHHWNYESMIWVKWAAVEVLYIMIANGLQHQTSKTSPCFMQIERKCPWILNFKTLNHQFCHSLHNILYLQYTSLNHPIEDLSDLSLPLHLVFRRIHLFQNVPSSLSAPRWSFLSSCWSPYIEPSIQ